MNSANDAKAEHADKMKRMGASFAKPPMPTPYARLAWTSVEVATCQAMGHAALRLGSEARLASTIEMFGGLPLDLPGPGFGSGRSDGPCLLWRASSHADGFGFEMILAAVQDMAEAEAATGCLRHLDGGGSFISRWLRRGLVNHGEREDDDDAPLNVETAINQAAERSIYVSSPVGSCFGNDNPIALAILLSDPSRFGALLASEPSGVFVAGALGREPCALLAKEAEAQDAWMEKTLFWQALNCGAWRCAGLLASIPEFGAKALTPRMLGFAFAESYRSQRSTRCGDSGEVAEANEYFADAFSRALRVAEASVDRGTWRHKSEAWLAMVESMILAAPAEAKAWVSVGGLSLPEIFLGGKPDRYQRLYYEIESLSSPQTLAAGKRIFAAFESAGFDMRWEALSARCADIPVLGEWIARKMDVANEAAELAAAASPATRSSSSPRM